MFANQNVFDLQTLVHKVIRLALFFVWWKKVYIIVYCNCKVENYDDVTGLYGKVVRRPGRRRVRLTSLCANPDSVESIKLKITPHIVKKVFKKVDTDDQ